MSAHNTYGLKVQFTGLASQQKAAATQQMQSTLHTLADQLLKKYTADLIQQMIAPGPFAPPPPRRPVELNCKTCSGAGVPNVFGADQNAKPGTRCKDCSGTGRPPIPFTEVWDLPNEAEKATDEQAVRVKQMTQHAFNVAGNGTFFQKQGSIQDQQAQPKPTKAEKILKYWKEWTK